MFQTTSQYIYIYRTASFSIKKKQSFSIAKCIFFPSRNGSTREASSGRSKSTSLVPWKSLVWEAVFGDFQWTIQKSPYTNNLVPVLCVYIYRYMQLYACIYKYKYIYICNYMHVYIYIHIYMQLYACIHIYIYVNNIYTYVHTHIMHVYIHIMCIYT